MEKRELKYIIYSTIFAIVWFFIILPPLIEKFNGNSPFFQFAVFNMGLYIIFFIFLKSKVMSTKTNIKLTIGLLCLFLALDAWLPEYHVNIKGELIKGADLGVSAVDYVSGLIAINLGLTGVNIFAFTYIVIPVMLLIISAKLLPNFVNRL